MIGLQTSLTGEKRKKKGATSALRKASNTALGFFRVFRVEAVL